MRLLDFDPDNTLKADVKVEKTPMQLALDSYEVDIHYGFTPDRARLRYNGAQSIFIWDELKSTNNMKSVTGVDQDKGWRITHYDVHTKNSYRPMRDMNGSILKYHLPLQMNWPTALDLTDDRNKKAAEIEALPVQGRLYDVNLACLDMLDRHYLNTSMTTRAKILITSRHSSQEKWVWAYMSKLEAFAKWEVQPNNKYYMRDGVEPGIVRAMHTQGGSAYEVDAFNS